MTATVIYDGNCNLCITFVKLLERLDRGQMFAFVPMQESETLTFLQITVKEMDHGVILLKGKEKFQGTAAIQAIGEILPGGRVLVDLYTQLPGAKSVGDQGYSWVKDNRYQLFGQCPTYRSDYPFCPPAKGCSATVE